MEDVCFIYTNTETQGRLGTHIFDLVLPPLGMTYLAAVLEKEGYSVRIIDANAELLNDEELLEGIKNRFKIIGFYCHTQNYYKILELAAYLKKTSHPPFIVIGGPHATALPEECLEGHPELDAVVFGEGEETISELTKNVLADRGLSGIKGIAYRGNGGIVKNPRREYIKNLDSIPMPAWHLLPMKRYRNLIESGGKSVIQIMGSRGCHIDCNYCFSTKMWSPNVRWHSPERLLAEIDHLQAHYGIKFFEFLDDNFTLDQERVLFLTSEFRKRKVDWCCSTRIDLLNEEILEQLKLGGIHHVAIGIETVNDRLLQVIGKKITKRQTIKTINLCAKYKVRVLGMFIFGIPTETMEEAEETITFALKNKFYIAVFSHMTFYPGTNFWEEYKDAQGLSRDFSQYCLSKNFSYIDPNRKKEELEALMKRAYLKFYIRPRILFILTFLMLKNPGKLLELFKAFTTILVNLLKSR